MTYDSRERSVQDGQPVEIYTFALPTATYRLTSHDQDVTFDSLTYITAPISRGNLPLQQLGKGGNDLTISIALDHALAVAMRAYGIAPDALVTIKRYHVGDSEARILRIGYVRGTSIDDQFTHVRVSNRSDDYFEVGLPVPMAQRSCSHMLYDRGCTINPEDFKISPTVSSSSGTALVVSSISSKPDHWARYGKVVRMSTAEERSIIEQVGTTLTLDYAFGGLANGEALSVYAGCDHSIDGAHGCFPKFDNVLNFGGEPEMPVGNPGAPTGYGVVVQV